MADGFDLERLLAGRVLALDRDALPGLASRAQLQAAGFGAAELEDRAGLLAIAGRGSLTVAHYGSVAIVPITGMITSDAFIGWLVGGMSPDALVCALQEAIDDPQITAILLLVNSPGGEISLLTETAATIRQLRTIKPITAIARPLAGSAAYWLAAQATTVLATPSADVGSVGVFCCHYDYSGLNDRIGVVPTYIASDPRKVEGNPDAPLEDDARAFIQKHIDKAYATFVADLALGRNTTTTRVRADFGGGRCFTASEAVVRGLVDRVAPLDRTLAELLTASTSSRTGRKAVTGSRTAFARPSDRAFARADTQLAEERAMQMACREDADEAEAERDATIAAIAEAADEAAVSSDAAAVARAAER